MAQMLSIPVVKAGKGHFVTFDVEQVPEYIHVHAVAQGYKGILNGGSTNIESVRNAKTDKEREEFEAKAVAHCQSRVDLMLAGKLSLRGAGESSTKLPASLVNEARRIARQLVKDVLKANGLKVAHYSASDITAAANEMLNHPEDGPNLLAMAQENLDKRKQTNIKVDLSKLKVSPEAKAKAEAKAADKKKKPIPAGIVAGRGQQGSTVRPH